LRAESRGVFQRKHFGPWNLGNWSKPINVLSLLWIAFISIMMVIPPNQTAAYALIAMFVVLIIMDLAYYRKHFAGPQAALSTSAEEIKRQEAKFRE
ncbi:amino acid transporter, partial [Mesorhizobium sp. M00.F.Ca.ET.186.01.1.1]